MNQTRHIDYRCGNWEEMPADQPRDKSQSFAYQSDTTYGEAYYNCNKCGSQVVSYSEDTDDDDIGVISETVEVTHRYAENEGCLIQRTGWANYEGVTVSIVGKDVLTPVTIELTHEQAEILKAVL